LPGARVEHTAIYDPVRDRMVVYGNEGPGANDVWALTLSGTPLWTPLAPAGGPPPARYGHTAIYDPLRDRMVVFGGDGDGNNFNDAWALTWGTPLAVDGDARGRIQMGVVRPNPARGVTFVDFELREPARVVLDVFDTQGRRVRRIADGWFPAGRHASAWRGDDDQGHALESGVYLVRMRQGSFQATRRIVRVR
jgi:hypothetical protein